MVAFTIEKPGDNNKNCLMCTYILRHQTGFPKFCAVDSCRLLQKLDIYKFTKHIYQSLRANVYRHSKSFMLCFGSIAHYCRNFDSKAAAQIQATSQYCSYQDITNSGKQQAAAEVTTAVHYSLGNEETNQVELKHQKIKFRAFIGNH